MGYNIGTLTKISNVLCLIKISYVKIIFSYDLFVGKKEHIKANGNRKAITETVITLKAHSFCIISKIFEPWKLSFIAQVY